jgi:hypothetical protein
MNATTSEEWQPNIILTFNSFKYENKWVLHFGN